MLFSSSVNINTWIPCQSSEHLQYENNKKYKMVQRKTNRNSNNKGNHQNGSKQRKIEINQNNERKHFKIEKIKHEKKNQSNCIILFTSRE